MDYRARIVAGTALALIMAAPSLAATPLSRTSDEAATRPALTKPLVLAQAEGEGDEDDLRREPGRADRRRTHPRPARASRTASRRACAATNRGPAPASTG